MAESLQLTSDPERKKERKKEGKKERKTKERRKKSNDGRKEKEKITIVICDKHCSLFIKITRRLMK